jgi:hypothetical protein
MTSQSATLRISNRTVIWSLTAVIALTILICLIRLSQLKVEPWPVSFVTFADTSLVALLVLLAVQQLAAKASMWSNGALILTSAILLLSVIGLLLRISLAINGSASWSEPLIGLLGLAAFFLGIEVASSPPEIDYPLAMLIWPAVLTLGLFEIVERHQLAGVPSGGPSAADWPTTLLTLLALGFLAIALTSEDLWLWRWYERRRGQALRELTILRTALPTVLALALLAFTANLSAGIALLAGGLGMLVFVGPGGFAEPASPSADPGARARPDQGVVGLQRAIRLVMAGLFCIGGFAAGALLIAIVGGAIGTPGMSTMTGMTQRTSYPYVFLYDHPRTVGPGFNYRHAAPATLAAGQDILTTLGRETGVLGILGVGLIFLVLLVSLLSLLRYQVRRSAQFAWICGLAVFIACQVLVSGLRAGRVPSPYSPGPPLLAGGSAWYIATLLALGIAIGLTLGRTTLLAGSPVRRRGTRGVPRRQIGDRSRPSHESTDPLTVDNMGTQR